MTNLLYSTAYALALPFVLPGQYIRRPSDMRGKWLRQKLGHMDATDGDAPVLWVHAVSVGEAMAAETLIKAFRERHPDWRVAVSTITDTGRKVALERLGSVASVIYLPLDLPMFLRRAIGTIRPSLFVVMETEIWPNLFAAMREAGVPVALLNGRISRKSYRSYLKIKFLFKEVLDDVDLFSMQDEAYAGRIRAMGADPARVEAVGNFKFDLELSATELPWADSLEGITLVAGSTHSGEDEIIIDAFERLRNIHDISLIHVPRHPERSGEVCAILDARGISYKRLSRMDASAPAGVDVVVVDIIGVLGAIYASADIAIMGGSFIPHGGQNPLEPAYWGKPVVCGPHMFNFPFIEDFYARDAALKTTAEGLVSTIEEMLISSDKRETVGSRAKDILMDSRGAVARALVSLERLIK